MKEQVAAFVAEKKQGMLEFNLNSNEGSVK